MTWKIGDRVRAKARVYDANDGSPNDPVRAEAGQEGRVEYVDDDGVPTVRFPGGATIVADSEVEKL